MNVAEWKEVGGLIVMAIVMVFVPYVLKPYLSLAKVKAERAWSDFSKEQPALAVYLSAFARNAVIAAEQAKLGDELLSKKTYAMDTVTAWLRHEGYLNVDITLIDAAIEQAVMEVFNPERLGWFGDVPEPDIAE